MSKLLLFDSDARDALKIGVDKLADAVKITLGPTSEVAGDGTTTATILAQCMIGEGLKSITAGAVPIEIKRASMRRRKPWPRK